MTSADKGVHIYKHEGRDIYSWEQTLRCGESSLLPARLPSRPRLDDLGSECEPLGNGKRETASVRPRRRQLPPPAAADGTCPRRPLPA